MYRLYADGACRGNPGPAASGAVVCDESDRILAEAGEYIGTATNNVAEYRGLISALRLLDVLDPHAKESGVPIEVRMDSKLVVEQMAGRWSIKNDALRALALEARGLWPRDAIRFTWIPRESNAEADRLGNEVLDAVAVGGTGTIRRILIDEAAVGAGALEPHAEIPKRLLTGTGDQPLVTYLVRHGHTDHTTGKRFSGWNGSDPDLDEVGRKEAVLIAEELRRRGGADAIVTSPMRRTLSTAEAIAEQLGLPMTVEPDLREADFGEWDGMTFQEVFDDWPDQANAWLASTSQSPPGGESIDSVHSRAVAALERFVSAHAGRRVVVVSHMTPILALVRHAIGADSVAMWRMRMAPASLTTISWWPDGSASLSGFGESSHLI